MDIEKSGRRLISGISQFGWTEENHENLQSGLSMSRPNTDQIQRQQGRSAMNNQNVVFCFFRPSKSLLHNPQKISV
jgi:hypothetical protein